MHLVDSNHVAIEVFWNVVYISPKTGMTIPIFRLCPFRPFNKCKKKWTTEESTTKSCADPRMTGIYARKTELTLPYLLFWLNYLSKLAESCRYCQGITGDLEGHTDLTTNVFVHASQWIKTAVPGDVLPKQSRVECIKIRKISNVLFCSFAILNGLAVDIVWTYNKSQSWTLRSTLPL